MKHLKWLFIVFILLTGCEDNLVDERVRYKLKGNVNSEKTSIKKTANIEGVLNQKSLSIQEGAQLKIKTETYK